LLKEGLAITNEFGMVPLGRRIAERVDKLEAPLKVQPSYPDNLTKREVEVLQLIAKGFTNKDIGDLLNISIKTVATHATHIFEKTGSANRAEASAYAIRNGLVEE
jgi:DNA-binding NarL/FixJ family response regulator